MLKSKFQVIKSPLQSNFRQQYIVLFKQHELSSKNHWSQTVKVRALKPFRRIVHVPNNVNMKGHVVNLKTDSLKAYAANVKFPREICFFLAAQHDLSSENHWSQTVWVRTTKIYIQIVHIPNNLNMKGHVVNLKSGSFTAFAANAKFAPKIFFLSRTKWAWFKEPVKTNGLS